MNLTGVHPANVPEPKRKPAPTPLGTSATGRKRYRATMQEAEAMSAEILALRAERDAALSRAATWRLWCLYFTPFVFFTMGGVCGAMFR